MQNNEMWRPRDLFFLGKLVCIAGKKKQVSLKT